MFGMSDTSVFLAGIIAMALLTYSAFAQNLQCSGLGDFCTDGRCDCAFGDICGLDHKPTADCIAWTAELTLEEAKRLCKCTPITEAGDGKDADTDGEKPAGIEALDQAQFVGSGIGDLCSCGIGMPITEPIERLDSSIGEGAVSDGDEPDPSYHATAVALTVSLAVLAMEPLYFF